ncbi:hydrogenase/urease nickel incorporation protein HypA [Helicobacter sp. 23-1045]
MHEYSIVQHLIELSEQNARQNNAKKIHKITIAVGERSAVEVELLKSAFEVFKKESEICVDSALEVRRIAVELRCQTCNANFKAKGLEYGLCIFCGSRSVEIAKGMELDLLRLEMEGG